MGVNDAMYLALWVRHFLEKQGCAIKDNIVYQDNQSAMKLENNGRASRTKNTRHMEIRYFLSHIIFGEINCLLNTVPPVLLWVIITPNLNRDQE